MFTFDLNTEPGAESEFCREQDDDDGQKLRMTMTKKIGKN